MDEQALIKYSGFSLLLLVLLCTCLGCSSSGRVTSLVSQVHSPNGKCLATLYSEDAGATVSTRYYMTITSSVEKGEGQKPLIESDHLQSEEGFALKWVDNRSIIVAWPHSRILRKEKFAIVDGEQVDIILKELSP